MALTYTQAQRDEWVDLQMQKAAALDELDSTVYTEPADLEPAQNAAAIAQKRAELRKLFEDETLSRDEYVKLANAKQAELNTLLEQDQQREGRNEVKRRAAQAAFETARAAKEKEVDDLKTTERGKYWKPPFEERKGGTA
jgi:hypothetical protein